MKTENIFITGATGFIGRNLVQRLLLKDATSRLFLLIRSRKSETADVRFFNFVHQMTFETGLPKRHLLDRLILVQGDLESEHFGLSKKLFTKLAGKIDTIIHVAASVKLHDSLFRLRRINLGGSMEIIKFARQAQLKNGLTGLHYLSTAYVAGRRKGLILEEELDAGQTFLCNYEQVKFEAEKLFRSAMSELPVTVHRPSMVVGDSISGATCAFNVIYEPLKMLLAGKLPVWSADARTKIDVVPVDYVCDAMLCFLANPDKVQGKTFHLSVGADREILSETLMRIFLQHLADIPEIKARKPIVISPNKMRIFGKIASVLGNPKWQRIGQQWMTYADYTGFPKSFDNRNTLEILGPAGLRPPRLEEYFPAIFDFALLHQFKTPKPTYMLPTEYSLAS